MIILNPLADFRHPITRSTNFQEDFCSDRGGGAGCDEELGIFVVFGGTSGEVRLVLFALRVGEVRTFVCV